MAALTMTLSILTKYIIRIDDPKALKAATPNSIPSACVELFLLSIERYHKLKNELKLVIVSTTKLKIAK